MRNDIAGNAAPGKKKPPCIVEDGRKKTYDEEACSKEEIRDKDLVRELLIFEEGLQAFTEFNPIRDEPYDNGARKFYRYRTFGQDAALFVLDARSFRDEQLGGSISGLFGVPSGRALSGPPPRFGEDDPTPSGVDYGNKFYAKRHEDRHMLGRQQFADLKGDLEDAEDNGILWKFIAIPEPIQHLGLADAQERYEGYAEERDQLLEFIQVGDEGGGPISNVVFISGDIHGTIVNNLVYREQNLSRNGKRSKKRKKKDQKFTRAWGISTGPLAHGTLGNPEGKKQHLGPKLKKEVDYYKDLERKEAATLRERMNGRDRYVEKRLNRFLAKSDYPQVGLCGKGWEKGDGGPAELLVGSYLAVNTFGWTEFEIEADSNDLVVTTWGIEPYDEDDLEKFDDGEDEASFLADRTPEVMSRFRVSSSASGSTKSTLRDECIAYACSTNSDCDQDQGDVCNRERCIRQNSLPVGERCSTDAACRGNAVCRGPGIRVKRCVRLGTVPAGSKCDSNEVCQDDHLCSRGKCVKKGSLEFPKRCDKDGVCRSGLCEDGRCEEVCGDGFCEGDSGLRGKERCGDTNDADLFFPPDSSTENLSSEFRDRNECRLDCGKCERKKSCRRDADCNSGRCGLGLIDKWAGVCWSPR